MNSGSQPEPSPSPTLSLAEHIKRLVLIAQLNSETPDTKEILALLRKAGTIRDKDVVDALLGVGVEITVEPVAWDVVIKVGKGQRKFRAHADQKGKLDMSGQLQWAVDEAIRKKIDGK